MLWKAREIVLRHCTFGVKYKRLTEIELITEKGVLQIVGSQIHIRWALVLKIRKIS